MASQPISQQDKKPPHGVPYCSDPDCEYCKDLRAMQEAIRLHRPIQGAGKVRNANSAEISKASYATVVK